MERVQWSAVMDMKKADHNRVGSFVTFAVRDVESLII